MAGVGVGALYALAATRIKNGGDYGYEVAAGASALLLSSSAPRFRKGPVPMGLTLTSALALAYYGKKVRISVQSCVSPYAHQNRQSSPRPRLLLHPKTGVRLPTVITLRLNQPSPCSS